MGVSLGMTRLYGWSLRGKRIEEYVPDVRFERTSVIAAIGLEGYIAPWTYKNTLNGNLWTVPIKDILTPEMKAGDILILDNLSVHKVKNMECLKPLTDKGVTIIWLPPYSSDLNPIELSWSKLKAYIRKRKPRTFDELIECIKEGIEKITKDDIENWFRHDGYILAPLSVNV